MAIIIALQAAVAQLKKGHTLLFCSDEGWVIGCDAAQPEAVARLIQIRQPTEKNPCTLLISEIGLLQQFVQQVPEIAWDLVEFAEKPLTVVYPKGKNVAPAVLSSDGRIALRLVKKETANNSDCQALVSRFGRGLATISVSSPNQSPVNELSAIAIEVQQGVDFTLQHHSTEKVATKPATIVQLELDGQIRFIRK